MYVALFGRFRDVGDLHFSVSEYRVVTKNRRINGVTLTTDGHEVYPIRQDGESAVADIIDIPRSIAEGLIANRDTKEWLSMEHVNGLMNPVSKFVYPESHQVWMPVLFNDYRTMRR